MKRAHSAVRERNTGARTPRWAVLGATLLGLIVPATNVASAQAAGPRWEITSVSEPTVFPPAPVGENSSFYVVVTNIGNAPQGAEELTITDHVPAGVTATAVNFLAPQSGDSLNFHGDHGQELCTIEAAGSLVTCVYPGHTEDTNLTPLRPEQPLLMAVIVNPEPGFEGTIENSATVSGGGAADVTATSTGRVGEPIAPFGFSRVQMQAREEDGSPYTQAGGHPYELSTTIYLNTAFAQEGERVEGLENALTPTEQVRDLVTELPPGLIGDPLSAGATARCSLADFQSEACTEASQVGVWGVFLPHYKVDPSGGVGVPTIYPFNGTVLNMVPSRGQAAQLGLRTAAGFTFILEPSVRSGADYGIRATSGGILYGEKPWGFYVTLWGDPGAAAPGGLAGTAHAPYGKDCLHPGNAGIWSGSCPIPVEPSPFLTMPTSCSGSPLAAGISGDSWVHPGIFASTEATMPAVQGCNQLHFGPTIESRPTTDRADSPSGLNFDLKVPQHFGAGEQDVLATSDLRDAVVTLPKGLTVNPSSANGLGACTEQQVGYKAGSSEPLEFTPGPAECPDAAKLGTVEIASPLLDHPIGNGGSGDPAGDVGAVYLAKPYHNPFGSLLAIYLTVYDPVSGVVVKLAGKVTPGPDGQLTTSFTENPQLPFEDFYLRFFGGARGALRTPPICGGYETTSVLTPWSAPESGPPAEKSDEFQITGAAQEGGICPRGATQEENSPRFHAGTETPQAGTFSPFAFKLTREDGSQELSRIETTLPPGLVGKLAGVGKCSEGQIAQAREREHQGGGTEELASPSCPSSSEVGTVEVGAGAGPTPYYTQGRAYLAGPYEGAPLSLVIITPAVAGPFDLGAVVVRTALYLNPETAQIKAVSDEIPHILQGIPLDVRSVTLKMNRPNFTLNPTNCNELGFTGNETSVLGSIAPLTQRFQVGGCSALPFKPKLKLSLKGSTKRTGHPALKATLTMKPGSANIAKAQVTLPHAEFLDQGHIQNICTQVQFKGAGCPKSSILGYARAITPLLDHPLEGPVYLMSGFGHKLPDVAADLNGQIRVLLHGKVDSGPGGGIRNTFEVVPDAPVTKFTLSLKGGSRGLIQNSENTCKHPHHALAVFIAQNNKESITEPAIGVRCPKGHKGKGHHRHGKRHRPSRGG